MVPPGTPPSAAPATLSPPSRALGTADDVTIGTDTTDATGTYGFTGLAAGTYVVRIDGKTIPDGYDLQVDGVFEIEEAVSTEETSWGSVKALFN